jgi:glycosyltransferase involved in cell wall biosynthesis
MKMENNNSDFFLQRTPKSPPVIPPHTGEADRPFWSVMIPVYNQPEYFKEALQKVLAQDIGRNQMQIMVVDDHSTIGDIEEITRALGGDRVEYYRQPQNVGSLRNLETCIKLSRGYWVHLHHCDDYVKPGFYQNMQKLLQGFPEAGAAFCRYSYIRESGVFLYHTQPESDVPGIVPDMLERLGTRQRLQSVAMVVKREVYEKLGSFHSIHYGEDWEMWIRIAAHYPIAYHPEIMAAYRRHQGSITGAYFKGARNVEDLRFVMESTRHLFDPIKWKAINRKARKFYAFYALDTANYLWHDVRSKEGAMAQMNAAFDMYTHPLMYWKALKNTD